jgi:CRISPR-associated protein Csb3
VNDIILGVCEPGTLLSHLALYGLAAILQAEGAPGVRAGWTGGGNPRPYMTGPGLDEATTGTLISQHARSAHAEGSWLHCDITLNGTPRALMSPRLTPFGDEEAWRQAQRSRHEILDALTTSCRWLDLRLLASLGEPCYWRRNRQRAILQDDGASRLEMQPRNQGSEFVGNRLRKLAGAVAARDPAQIMAGLLGDTIRDEIGGDKPDSRTATGLASPGPTDNALARCALWGISQLPLAMRVNTTAVTSGHLGQGRNEWFYVPVWRGEWQPARLRSILASAALRVTAATRLGLNSDAEISAASAWLSARGVEGLVRFPIQRFGSGNAPERRAMRGEPIPT